MDQLTIAAASGMRSRMESLEMLANNISNANTAGYKADREFYTLYAAAEAQASGNSATMPMIERNWTDFTQGTLAATGNPLDLAIEGKGFFAVDSPAGTVYTRAVSFQLSNSGILQTKKDIRFGRQAGSTLRPTRTYRSSSAQREKFRRAARCWDAWKWWSSRVRAVWLNKEATTFVWPARD